VFMTGQVLAIGSRHKLIMFSQKSTIFARESRASLGATTRRRALQLNLVSSDYFHPLTLQQESMKRLMAS
jgi:hypothetical protein